MTYSRNVKFRKMGKRAAIETWQDLFAKYQRIIGDRSLLKAQHDAFRNSRCANIADPAVRGRYTPIQNDSWVDLTELSCERLRMMPSPTEPLASPDCNSGFPYASKMRPQLYASLRNMTNHLDDLSATFGFSKQDISIRIFEAFRDLKTQEMLFNEQVSRILSDQPDMSLEEAESHASRWVSPVKDNVPVHSTGLAVDLRLWNNRKDQFLDLGSFGVIWTTNKVAPTFCEEITLEQKLNRLFCLIAAERAGLTNYPFEFWHFSIDDAYSKWSLKLISHE